MALGDLATIPGEIITHIEAIATAVATWDSEQDAAKATAIGQGNHALITRLNADLHRDALRLEILRYMATHGLLELVRDKRSNMLTDDPRAQALAASWPARVTASVEALS